MSQPKVFPEHGIDLTSVDKSLRIGKSSRSNINNDELQSLLPFQLVRDIALGDMDGLKACLECHDKNDVINKTFGWNECTALLLAASLPERLDMIRLLVAAGADVNKENKLKNTALGIAAENGFFDYMQFLVENGADISKENAYKQTGIFSHFLSKWSHFLCNTS